MPRIYITLLLIMHKLLLIWQWDSNILRFFIIIMGYDTEKEHPFGCSFCKKPLRSALPDS